MSKSKQKRSGKSKTEDVEDPIRDQEKLDNDQASINLPDVKDIPGQEHVHPPDLRQFADTTISSADEEGDTVWNGKTVTDQGSDVSAVERSMLDASANDMPTKDEQSLRRAVLDSTDSDGDPLNEKSSAISGSDLDVPGADADNNDEAIGEEDEENNPYSLGGDNNSINEERSGA